MDEYRIVTVDGKEFGPVDLAGLQQWIREGRVLKTSRVRKNDGAAIIAEALPELAGAFLPPPTGPTVPPIATTVPIATEFRSWDFIGQGWELLKPHWLVLSAMFLLSACLASALGLIPILGTFIGMALTAAFQVGINRALLGVLAGREPTFEMMFGGFDRFGAAFLAALLSAIFIMVGFVLLIVPGIIVAIMLMFVNFVLADTNQDFWTAMKTSADLTKGYRWSLFCLFLAFIPIILLGLIVVCVGVFVAQAVCFMALAIVYRFLQTKKSSSLVPA
jgi:uncharacterized membrane protein